MSQTAAATSKRCPAPLPLTDLDREVWEQELACFVPSRVFDAHTHIYQWEHCLDLEKDCGPFASSG